MILDRVHHTSATLGTGAYTLGAVATGKQSLLDAITRAGRTPAGFRSVFFALPDDSSDDFEAFWGEFDGDDQLTREVFRSTNGNAPVNWTGGTRNIVLSPPADLLSRLFDTVNCGLAGGSENSLSLTPNMPIFDRGVGRIYTFIAATTNTGPVDAVLTDGDAIDVQLHGQPLQQGDICAGLYYGLLDLGSGELQLQQFGSITALFEPLRVRDAVNFGGQGVINEGFGATLDPGSTGWGALGGTVDIWNAQTGSAAFGNAIPLAGPGTISSFGTAPQAGAARELMVMSSLTLANSANLVVQGAADFVCAAGDRLRVRALSTTKVSVSIDKASVAPGASLIVADYFDAVAAASGSSTVARSNSTPTTSDGTQVWSRSHTLAAATNRVVIAGSFLVDNSAVAPVILLFFRDTTFIGAAGYGRGSAASEGVIAFTIKDEPGDTSAHTYKIHAASSTSGTWYVNQAQAAYYAGGYAKNGVVFQEHKV